MGSGVDEKPNRMAIEYLVYMTGNKYKLRVGSRVSKHPIKKRKLSNYRIDNSKTVDMTSLLVDAFDAVATAVCSLAFENISRSKRERGDGSIRKQ
jgi:hypothetical protein